MQSIITNTAINVNIHVILVIQMVLAQHVQTTIIEILQHVNVILVIMMIDLNAKFVVIIVKLVKI